MYGFHKVNENFRGYERGEESWEFKVRLEDKERVCDIKATNFCIVYTALFNRTWPYSTIASVSSL